jgi:hypothetical protein
MVQAAGIRLDLTGPRPVAPPHSLIKTPGVVQDGPARWLNGVNVIGYPEDTPILWEPCSEGTFREKDEGTARPQATFDAFVAYLPVTCSTFGAAELPDQAEVVLEATVSMAAETALSQGISGSSNPYFGDAGLSVLGGGAVSAAVGLSYLEDAIGGTGRGGIIHATPAVVAALSVELDADDPIGVLMTANGTPVVSGDGYIGADPVAAASPGTGQGYMFATGPVEIRLGPGIITDLVETLDRSDNTVTFRAERYVLATWDTALQVAVLVDWSP